MQSKLILPARNPLPDAHWLRWDHTRYVGKQPEKYCPEGFFPYRYFILSHVYCHHQYHPRDWRRQCHQYDQTSDRLSSWLPVDHWRHEDIGICGCLCSQFSLTLPKNSASISSALLNVNQAQSLPQLNSKIPSDRSMPCQSRYYSRNLSTHQVQRRQLPERLAPVFMRLIPLWLAKPMILRSTPILTSCIKIWTPSGKHYNNIAAPHIK